MYIYTHKGKSGKYIRDELIKFYKSSKFIKILPSINYFKANKIYAVFRLDISLYKLSFEKKFFCHENNW